MAGNIKGITIEFRGDTTKLDKAVREIDKNTSKLDRELKQINTGLKFNPTSVDLWRQKQQVLTQKVAETRDKLSALKQAQAQMDAAGVDKNSEEYRKLQRDIVTTESKLKTFETQLKQIGNVNLRATSEQFKEMGTKLTAAGQAMKGVSMAAAGVVASVGAMAVKSAQAADDINTMSKKYSISTKDLQMYSLAAEQVDVSVETIAKSHVKLEKSMKSAQNGSKNQLAAFDALGVSIQNADGSLRDGNDVWNDTIAALGKMENETERDALAMQLMGKSASELNPLIEDGGETYQRVADMFAKYDLEVVDQETLDKANEFNDKIDDIKSMGTLALTTLGAKLADYFLPVMEKIVDVIGRIVSWMSNLNPSVLAVISAIAGVVAVIAPLLLIAGKLAFAISSITGLMATLGVSLAAIAGPVAIAIAAIIAIVLAIKNWDKIKEFVINVWESIKAFLVTIWEGLKRLAGIAFEAIKMQILGPIYVLQKLFPGIWNSIKNTAVNAWNSLKTAASTTWNAIKTAITSPLETAKKKIDEFVNKVKGIFPIKLGNIFNLKIPKINVNGGKAPFGIGGKGSLPSFSVEWHAKGGIFDSPSIIGVGEKGAEAVVPLDKFWDKLDNMQTPSQIVVNVYGSDNMSVSELAAEVERRIIEAEKRRRLAWQ